MSTLAVPFRILGIQGSGLWNSLRLTRLREFQGQQLLGFRLLTDNLTHDQDKGPQDYGFGVNIPVHVYRHDQRMLPARKSVSDP